MVLFLDPLFYLIALYICWTHKYGFVQRNVYANVYVYACVWRLEDNLRCHLRECSATSLRQGLSLSWRSVTDQWSSGILLSLLSQSALIISIHHHIQPFNQYYAGFVTMAMYYNLESDKICLAFFLFLRTALTTWVLLWSHRNFVIFFLFLWRGKAFEILIGIA